MRILLHLFGAEVLDLSIGPNTQAEPSDDPGSCTTYPIGFTAPPETPWEDPGWDRACE